MLCVVVLCDRVICVASRVCLVMVYLFIHGVCYCCRLVLPFKCIDVFGVCVCDCACVMCVFV